jgi:phosphate transport system substrate-binding protein
MSTKLNGRCLNIGNCTLANSMESISINEGDELLCPECGKTLEALPSRSSSSSGLKATPLIVIGAISVGLIYGGYGLISRRQSSVGQSDTSSNSGSPILRLVGSNTIGAKLGPELLGGYMKEKGCIDVDIKEPQTDRFEVSCNLNGNRIFATVESKGSGTAFKALKDGSADIGMASRRIKPTEKASLAALGDVTAAGSENVIALDGLAVIVNPANRIGQLSIDQVTEIFEGKKSSFSDLGGPSGQITLLRRDDKSGTFDTFKSLVMHEKSVSPLAKTFEDSRQLSQAVAVTPAGIGFVGFTYIGAARAVPISSAQGQQALLPTRFTIATEDYPLSRRLYLYSKPNNVSPEVAQFIRFALSTKGQSIVENLGFVPLEISSQAKPVAISGSSEYQTLTQGSQRLSVNFRFNSGSDELDNRAVEDLNRVAKYLITTSSSPSKLVLIGFADSTGQPAGNLALSKQRAATVARKLQPLGISPGVVTGLGSENPVAPNDTPEGQQKNRRVEVWIRQ